MFSSLNSIYTKISGNIPTNKPKESSVSTQKIITEFEIISKESEPVITIHKPLPEVAINLDYAPLHADYKLKQTQLEQLENEITVKEAILNNCERIQKELIEQRELSTYATEKTKFIQYYQRQHDENTTSLSDYDQTSHASEGSVHRQKADIKKDITEFFNLFNTIDKNFQPSAEAKIEINSINKKIENLRQQKLHLQCEILELCQKRDQLKYKSYENYDETDYNYTAFNPKPF